MEEMNKGQIEELVTKALESIQNYYNEAKSLGPGNATMFKAAFISYLIFPGTWEKWRRGE